MLDQSEPCLAGESVAFFRANSESLNAMGCLPLVAKGCCALYAKDFFLPTASTLGVGMCSLCLTICSVDEAAICI